MLEQIAHPGRANTDKHLDKVRATEAEKWHLRFPCNRLRQQSLTGSGRADQQGALRDFGTQLRVLVWALQKIHDLLELLLGPVHTSHIRKRDIRALPFFKELGLGFANVEDLTTACWPSTQSSHEEHPNNDHQAEENHPTQDLTAPLVGRLIPHFKTMVLLQLLQLGLIDFANRDVHGGIGPPVGLWKEARLILTQLQAVTVCLVVMNARKSPVMRHLGNVASRRQFLEFGPLQLLFAGRVPQHRHGQQEQGHDGVDPVEIELASRLLARTCALGLLVVVTFHGIQSLEWRWTGASPHNSSKA